MKKIMSFLLTIWFVISLCVITTSAAELSAKVELNSEMSSNYKIQDYQKAIERINERYGTSVHFASQSEIEKLGLEATPIDISPDEFEKYISQLVEINDAANKEADALSAKVLVAREKHNVTIGDVDSQKEILRSSYTVTRSKKVPGATVYLNATVNNNSGYWKYSSFNYLNTTYVAGVNSAPPFYLEYYTKSLIDAGRTYSINLYGETIGNYGVIIDNNAHRYVEFWAGSGM